MASIVRMLVAAAFAAVCGTASAQDYSRYRVIDTKVLDLIAGPANTAALLSPDGSRLLHVGSAAICLLEATEPGPWNNVGCIKKTRELELRGAEDLLWSPRGDRLVMPTYDLGLVMFRDTDIRTFDPQTMTVTNLTDDGVDDGFLLRPTPANFDLTARWLDDDTIAFLRYPITKEGAGKGGPPSLMAIEAAGGEPTRLATIPGAERIRVYVIAASADGRIAYSHDDRNDPGKAGGIYVLKAGSSAPDHIAAMADIGKPPDGIAFSADGKFLLLIASNEANTGLDARVLDLLTGKVVAVDATRDVNGVAWSPKGSALAYVVGDRDKGGEPGGLFLASSPGEPGRQVLEGAFMPPVCCGRLPFTWASNDTMVLGNVAKHDAPLLVRLGD